MRRCLLIFTLLISCVLSAEEQRPSGRFLYQPMLIWATGEVTHQGTGYLIEHDRRVYGITSVHFLNFEAGGLFEAIWSDIATGAPAIGFRQSLGKPERTKIERYIDIQYDYLVLPTEPITARHAALKLDTTAKYVRGTKLWFPNKTPDTRDGYEWIPAEVSNDEGHMIRVRLLTTVKLQSQSGSPLLRQDNGAVVGMLMGGDETDGKTELFLCPARGIAKHLQSRPAEMALLESIRSASPRKP